MTEPLAILSFNLRYATVKDGPNRWAARRATAVGLVRAHDPDLLFVQEMLDVQAADLDQGLPEWRRLSFGRDGPDEGERVGIYVKRARLAVLAHGGFWLSETPQVPSVGWDARMARVAVWGTLEDRATGRTVTAVGTHLDHLGPVSRREGVEQLKAWLQGRGPAVLAGDFNAEPDGPAYRGLEQAGLQDSYRAAGHAESGTTFHDFGRFPIQARIDWIWATPDLQVEAAGIDRQQPGGVWPSDHYPVWAKLSGG